MATPKLSEIEIKAAIYDLAEIANEYAAKRLAVIEQIQLLKAELGQVKAEVEPTDTTK